MVCEGCGILVAHGSLRATECAHGSGYSCCNCALDAGVFNQAQYAEYSCVHCKERLQSGGYGGRRRAAGEVGASVRRAARYRDSRARRQQRAAAAEVEDREGESEEEDELLPGHYLRTAAEAGASAVGPRSSSVARAAAAEIVAEAEMMREQILNQAQEDADRIRAEAASQLEDALAAAGRAGRLRGLAAGAPAQPRALLSSDAGSRVGHPRPGVDAGASPGIQVMFHACIFVCVCSHGACVCVHVCMCEHRRSRWCFIESWRRRQTGLPRRRGWGAAAAAWCTDARRLRGSVVGKTWLLKGGSWCMECPHWIQNF